MFRCATRSFGLPHRAIGIRYLHSVTGELHRYDAKGSQVITKVPIFVGNPGETYVLMKPEVGRALHAGRLEHARNAPTDAAAEKEDICSITYFHDSRHFGFGASSYPRLHIPNDMPRQTDSNTSPATLYLTGAAHELVLDGTSDAEFAELATASAKDLASVLKQLETM